MSDRHLVGGRYELAELLGRGGMAEVRRGTDVRLGRTVAVKRLRTDLASDATFQARFRREAQSAASLNHPAIVSVYDTGEEMSTDGTDVAQPYIVMEYVAGRTLRDILREGRKILPERALEITAGVLGALDYSHRMGIIHRDIKPGNVMLTPSGDVKVMDFGIARAVSDAQSTMTQTAAVVGTAQYLSPEQARGDTVDARSDVYSTGCLLYELLTGRPPFQGESPVSVAYQHVRETAPVPSAIDPDIPPELDALVMKSLAKGLDDRYQSAADMKADIDRYLAGRPVKAAAPVPVPAAAETSVIPAAAAVENTSEQRAVADDEQRRRGPMVLLGVLLLALLVLAAIFGPKLFSSSVEQVPVPSLSRMNESAARQTLTDQGLTAGNVTHENSESVPEGQVISQNPTAGSQVDKGSSVDFVVSSGQQARTIPNLIGMNKDDAAAKLRDLGLEPVLKDKQSDEAKDVVVELDPGVDEKVPAGSRVVVYFSTGPAQVPNVVGMQEADARKEITDAGFEVSVIQDSTTPATKGEVLQQSPGAGKDLNKGGTVTLVVSTYVEPTASPTPTPTPTDTGVPTPGSTPTDTGLVP